MRTGEQYRYANAVEARAEAMLAVNHGVVGLLYCESTGLSRSRSVDRARLTRQLTCCLFCN